MKIRYKFTIVLSIILIVLGSVLNLSVQYFLNVKMENSIKNSLKELMISSRENIKYTLVVDEEKDSTKALKSKSIDVIQYINLNYKVNSQINNIFDETLYTTMEERFKHIIDEQKEFVKQGSVVVDISYTDGAVWGILSYPIHINGVNIGRLSISKDYKDLYNENRITISYITLIQGIIFSAIFILASIVIGRIVTPIDKLTISIKDFSDGKYENNIKVTGNDEITVLTKEFINMKEKILSQIDTIRVEKEKVEKLEKSRKAFFDNVTHEIKTPLTAITGYAEMIRDNIIIDEVFKLRAIDRIHMESERLNLLIVDLINVSKGLSVTEESTSNISFKSLVEEITMDMMIKAKKYDINIVYNLQECNITCQKNKIREVVINLIDNAIKYSYTPSDIRLIGDIREGIYQFEVENIGEGIDESILQHIFEPFVKSNNDNDELSRGLGLFICKQIVEAHGGDISITSNKTIKVKVKLPIDVNNLEIT